jgi:hypothetical protein
MERSDRGLCQHIILQITEKTSAGIVDLNIAPENEQLRNAELRERNI